MLRSSRTLTVMTAKFPVSSDVEDCGTITPTPSLSTSKSSITAPPPPDVLFGSVTLMAGSTTYTPKLPRVSVVASASAMLP